MSERTRVLPTERPRSGYLDRELSRGDEAGPWRLITSLSDGDEPQDYGAFGWLRGIKDRAVMLELRRRNGNIIAIGYGWLERLEFDPSVGITLLVPGQRITIRGRHLNAEIRPGVRLFEGLARHRVPWIQEAEAIECDVSGPNSTVISTIAW